MVSVAQQLLEPAAGVQRMLPGTYITNYKTPKRERSSEPSLHLNQSRPSLGSIAATPNCTQNKYSTIRIQIFQIYWGCENKMFCEKVPEVGTVCGLSFLSVYGPRRAQSEHYATACHNSWLQADADAFP